MFWGAMVLAGACAVVGIVFLVFDHIRGESRARFYEAIEVDDVPRMVAELERFPSLIDSTSPTLRVSGDLSIYLSGETPLGVAVRNQSRHAFDHFIRLGVDVNDAGEAGFPPIVTAAAVDDDYYFTELLARGADPEISDTHGHDAMYWATKLDRQELLLAMKESKNAEQGSGGDP